MGRTYKQWRECTRKVKYDYKEQAEKYANKMNLHIRRGEPQYHAYKCSFCSSWHIGHSKRKGDSNSKLY